jgi:hypothetical protein
MNTPMNLFVKYLEVCIEISKEDDRCGSEALRKAKAVAEIYAEHERFMMGECFNGGVKHALAVQLGKEEDYPDFDKFIKKYE